jgi:hypothetical protein
VQDSIPLRIQRDEVQLLKATLEEPWQREHRQAMRAWDWEFIIGKCLQLPAAMERGWQITCREAVAGEIENLGERSKDVQSVFDLAIDVIQEAHHKAQEFAGATSHAIEGLEELDDALRELTALKKKHLFRLSLIDHEIIEEARAEHAAGDYPTADAALADLLAARHAARITPSYTELRRWADQSSPEPAWFEEDAPSP